MRKLIVALATIAVMTAPAHAQSRVRSKAKFQTRLESCGVRHVWFSALDSRLLRDRGIAVLTAIGVSKIKQTQA
jgi:hypothetical protein